MACDFRAARVRLLAATISRLAPGTSIVRLDATAALPFAPVFDRVLLDAPCSGLGIIRRDPDVKWRRRAEDLAALAAAELGMLVRAAEAVRPGGTLVYATCSSEPEENEDVVRAFLRSDPRFQPVPIAPGPEVDRAGSLIGGDGALRTLPHRDGLDAFFAAALVRREAP